MLALLASSGAARSDEPASAPAHAGGAIVMAPVEVSGFKNARVGYDRLLRGVDTFAKHHALAPAADLRFEVADRAEQPRPPLVVKLEIEERMVGIDLGEDARFALPGRDVAGPGDGELVSNRRPGQVRIYPSVRSPGTTDQDRRLGDLRAECEVLWTVYREETSFLLRNAADLMGGICRHASMEVGMPSRRKLGAVTLVSGERTSNVKISPTGLGYSPPLHDAAWPDDTRVRFTFE